MLNQLFSKTYGNPDLYEIIPKVNKNAGPQEIFNAIEKKYAEYSKKDQNNKSDLTEIGQLLETTKKGLSIPKDLSIPIEKKKSLGAKAKEIVSDNYKKFKEKPIDEHSTPVKGAIKLKNAAVKKLGWSK